MREKNITTTFLCSMIQVQEISINTSDVGLREDIQFSQ